MSDYRKAWKERGELYPCPNPSHPFQIGRLMGQWQWANDCWSSVSATGVMSNYGLCFCTLNTLNGVKVYKIIVWRLSVLLAFANAKPQPGEQQEQ